MSSETSNDVYQWAFGHDRIHDYGGSDRIEIFSAPNESALWFAQSGNDLKISIIGRPNDSLTVLNWFSMPARRVETISIGSSNLSHTEVQSLVNAMAEFGAPPPTHTLPPNYQASLNPVIASSWT